MLHTEPAFAGVDHIGITVADLERSIAFWERMLGEPGRDRRLLEGPRLASLLGYSDVRIDSYWFDLPGGVALELLHYLEPLEPGNDPSTAHPGNVHICLQVANIDAARAHAIAAGATAVSAEPIDIVRGPRAGAKMICVRDPDGVTIELFAPRATA